MRIVIKLQGHLRFGTDTTLEYRIVVVAINIEHLVATQVKLDRAAIEADIAAPGDDALLLLQQAVLFRAAI